MVLKYFFVSSTLLMAHIAAADVETNGPVSVVKREHHRYINKNCRENGLCGLKSFGIEVSNITINIDDSLSYSTEIRGHYETDRVADLEKFGVIQFIRGCMFTGRTTQSGYQKKMSGSRTHYNESKTPFQHKQWEVDTIDFDPLYTGYKYPDDWTGSRHAYYSTVAYGDAFSNSKPIYAVNSEVTKPIFYFNDRPSSAFATAYSTTNSSLEFLICVARIEDIPARGAVQYDPDKFRVCFKWQNNHIYKPELGQYVSDGAMDPVCEVTL